MENFKPRVGEQCETKTGGKWIKILPKYVGNNAIVFCTENSSFETASSFINSSYRPVQSKEEREIAELEFILCSKWGNTATTLALEIQKAGFTKQEQEK